MTDEPRHGPGEHVRYEYQVPAYVNRRVRSTGEPAREGTIIGFDNEMPRLAVRFDGDTGTTLLHPWQVTYLDNPLWMNHGGGPGITGCDSRPDGVHRFRDANGEHWTPTQPGDDWFRCEETDRGSRYWTSILSAGPAGDSYEIDGPPDPDRLRCGVVFTSRTQVGKFVQLTSITAGTVEYLLLDRNGEPVRVGRRRSGPRRRDRFTRDFVVYRPCRWALDCLAQATQTIRFDHIGEVPACAEHATEYQTSAAQPERLRGDEPEPECWCPDTNRLYADPVDYCPRCGTGPSRGTNVCHHRLAWPDPQPTTTGSQPR